MIEAKGEKHRNPFITKKWLWRLFLVIALPIHIWGFLLALRNVEMLSQRTNTWDAIAFVAYILVIALLESMFVFILSLAISWMLPRSWRARQRALALAALSFVFACWVVIRQLNYWNGPNKGIVLYLIETSNHVLRYGALVIFVGILAVLVSVVFPLLMIDRSPKFVDLLDQITERLALLSLLYIVLDVISIGIVVFRNLFI